MDPLMWCIKCQLPHISRDRKITISQDLIEKKTTYHLTCSLIKFFVCWQQTMFFSSLSHCIYVHGLSIHQLWTQGESSGAITPRCDWLWDPGILGHQQEYYEVCEEELLEDGQCGACSNMRWPTMSPGCCWHLGKWCSVFPITFPKFLVYQGSHTMQARYQPRRAPGPPLWSHWSQCLIDNYVEDRPLVSLVLWHVSTPHHTH